MSPRGCRLLPSSVQIIVQFSNGAHLFQSVRQQFSFTSDYAEWGVHVEVLYSRVQNCSGQMNQPERTKSLQEHAPRAEKYTIPP